MKVILALLDKDQSRFDSKDTEDTVELIVQL